MERGILGVKKDPKNPMLFSFSGGDGWPSSDSEDSDYTPDIASVKPRKRRGVAKTSDSEDSDYTPEATSVKPRKRRGIGLVKTSDSEDSDYAPEATSIKPRKRRGERLVIRLSNIVTQTTFTLRIEIWYLNFYRMPLSGTLVDICLEWNWNKKVS